MHKIAKRLDGLEVNDKALSKQHFSYLKYYQLSKKNMKSIADVTDTI